MNFKLGIIFLGYCVMSMTQIFTDPGFVTSWISSTIN